jgi:hypothetical protein
MKSRNEGRTAMDRILQALLRNDLRFFFRKVFATVYPGEIYSHNWHVEAIAHQLMRVHAGKTPSWSISRRARSSRCVSRLPTSLGFSAMIRHAASS